MISALKPPFSSGIFQWFRDFPIDFPSQERSPTSLTLPRPGAGGEMGPWRPCGGLKWGTSGEMFMVSSIENRWFPNLNDSLGSTILGNPHVGWSSGFALKPVSVGGCLQQVVLRHPDWVLLKCDQSSPNTEGMTGPTPGVLTINVDFKGHKKPFGPDGQHSQHPKRSG